MAQTALAHERLFALRSEIDRLESQKGTALARAARESPWDRPAAGDDGLIHSGAEGFDEALGGGIAKAALHEIRTRTTADNGAASGFALALGRLALGISGAGQARRILWIADPMATVESGQPYGPGLAGHGLPPAALVHARPRHLKDALMIAEAALAVESFAAVILEIYGNPQKLGLTESRRLHLRAKAHRRPILLLRERGEEEASSAVNRFCVRPSPSTAYILPNGQQYSPGLGNPVFQVAIEKSRNPSPPEFLLEWNADASLFRKIERFRTIDAGGIAVPAGRRPEDPRALFPVAGDRPDRAAALGQVMAFSRAS
jgi:protein ImuA